MRDETLSPSLWQDPSTTIGGSSGSAGAYELKCLVAWDTAGQLLDRASKSFRWDPHCESFAGSAGPWPTYHIESLYLDSDDLAVYRRLPGYSRKKYRVRRYGRAERVFVERKAKRRGLVRKRRTEIAMSDTRRLTTPVADSQWEAYWFHRRLFKQSLQPTIQVTYDRCALMADGPTGPIRLTVDQGLRCRVADGFGFGPWMERTTSSGTELFAGLAIVEFKFRDVLPASFRIWLDEFGLQPRPCSKYRTAIEMSSQLRERRAGSWDCRFPMSIANGKDCAGHHA